CGTVSKSTFFRKIKSGDYVGACNELPKWVYSGGKKLRGLEIRREKEKALCLAGLIKS
ncbi:glycoside hydrolase family protein, partial [Glaesserella parasuis]|nr:glycoside hydrolase family protein [Glaesserella parasuis]